MAGGEANESTPVVEQSIAHIGATVMGHHMFGGHPGPWDAAAPCNGWWSADPTFHFVTDGIASALAQARQAAGGLNVAIGGGANVAQQFLAAGLVDEMEINLVQILLGHGERLFEGLADTLHGLELVRSVAAPGVVHLKFAKR